MKRITTFFTAVEAPPTKCTAVGSSDGSDESSISGSTESSSSGSGNITRNRQSDHSKHKSGYLDSW